MLGDYLAITVLIADDSPFMLKLLEKTLAQDSRFKIIAKAKTGVECITKLIQYNPKVVILDIMLPDTSGINIVYQVMRAKPTPVLLFSALSKDDIAKDARIFNYGIVDFITKPSKDIDMDPVDFLKKAMVPKLVILAKLRIAKFLKVISISNQQYLDEIEHPDKVREIKLRQQSYQKAVQPKKSVQDFRKILIIGASTGGPPLLTTILKELPRNFPPVFIVQHIPSGFIENYVARANSYSKLNIVTASSGQVIQSNTVYFAPGGYHMTLIGKYGNGDIRIKLDDGPMVNFVKPAADVTIKSAVRIFKNNVVCAILTGMGKDGTEGAREVRKMGGVVLALHEEDSVVYGMNKSVVENGLANQVIRAHDLVANFKNYLA